MYQSKFIVISMLETCLTSSQVKITIVAQVNSMKIERSANPRNRRNFLIMKEWISATISRLGTSISTVVLVEAEEIEAVETEEVEEEMIGVEEAVAAVAMMKGADVEEEEVVVEDATALNIKNKKNISSRMIIEMETLSMVLELEMLRATAPLEKLSFTIIRPMRKSSPLSTNSFISIYSSNTKLESLKDKPSFHQKLNSIKCITQ